MLVRFFPEEIEADLAFKGIDLADWYTGKMSSRKLLVLLKALDEDGEYMTARRNGDWSDRTYRQAAVVNELRMLRVDQAALSGEKMDAVLMESPAQLEAKADEAAERNAVRTGILAQLHGLDLGKRAEDAS
jgi:hypothetical protein